MDTREYPRSFAMEELFQALNETHGNLGDDGRRFQYDRLFDTVGRGELGNPRSFQLALGLDLVDARQRAHARWHEACRLVELVSDDDSEVSRDDVRAFEMWQGLACRIETLADELLATWVLMSLGRITDSRQAEKLELGWSPACYELDGFMYVVAPADPLDDPKPVLTVVECEGGFYSDNFDA